MESKGTPFSTMFIYIAIAMIMTSGLVNLTQSFSVFYIIKFIIDLEICMSYYLLSQNKKIGFLLMWLGILIYILSLYWLLPQQLLTVLFSIEFLLNIAITCTIMNKLKIMK